MNRIRIAFVLFCALALLALIAPPAPAQTPLTPEALLELEGDDWTETMTSLFQEDRVDEYIAICNDSRERGVKTKYGEPLLNYLYDAFSTYYTGIGEGNRKGILEYIQRRAKENPDDLTWPVMNVSCLIDDAWMHRGSGWANTVTDDGWKGFYEDLNAAHAALLEILPNYTNDTKPHSQMVTVCMGLGRPEMEIYSHLRTAFRIDPIPLSPVRKAAYAFLPRWLGDNSGAKLVRLAEWCAQQSAATCGQAMYLVVAARAADWDGYDTVVNEYGFNPDRIAQASRDYVSRISDGTSIRHHAVWMLCMADKRRQAAALFTTLTYDESGPLVWSESTFDGWRSWAVEEGPKPGATALHIAARSGNESQIDRALTDGVDINGIDEVGTSAIQIAASENHWDAVLQLLSRGADPNVASHEKAAPLLLAVTEGKHGVVESLLKAGANPNVTHNGSSPLLAAVRNDSLDILSTLVRVEGIDVDIKGSRSMTPLFRAINDKKFDAAQILLDANADVKAVTTSGWTALSASILSGNIDVVKVLVERGAEPYSTAPNGWTAVHMAVFDGHTDIADYLLTLPGVTINKPMSDGWAPIHQASADGKPEMLAYVLARPDVDVNLATPQGQTGLHLAARDGREKEVRMLLEAGADPSLKNSDGKTPADLAAAKNFSKVVSLLQTR